MNSASIQHLVAMIVYMAIVIGIGIFFDARRIRTRSLILGGRSLGPWVTAFSAEASDMSGWLLMGLPGLAYWTGLADAGWTAIGLAVGTLNFLIVSKRLRRYSIKVDAFTIPDFFNRFREKKKILMTISSLVIIIFFSSMRRSASAPAASCFQSVWLVIHKHDDCLCVVLVYTFSRRFPRGERLRLYAGDSNGRCALCSSLR